MIIAHQLLVAIVMTMCCLVTASGVTHSPINDPPDGEVVRAQLTPTSTGSAWTATRLGQLKTMIRQLTAMPTYLRLSHADYLIDELLNSDVVEMEFYEWEPGTRDLRHVAVRAAWFLEELLGIELPMIAEQPTGADRVLAHHTARLAYDAYRRGVLDMVEEYRIGWSRGAMVRRFQDAIQKDAPEDPGWAFWSHSFAPFQAMLKEWFPLDKTFDDLEFIVGRKAARVIDALEVAPPETQVYMYRFGNGGGGSPPIYYFFVKDGIITHVFRR